MLGTVIVADEEKDQAQAMEGEEEFGTMTINVTMAGIIYLETTGEVGTIITEVTLGGVIDSEKTMEDGVIEAEVTDGATDPTIDGGTTAEIIGMGETHSFVV